MNNLLLAKLLKNFRWLFLFALIHELLNKSINLSKVFKFVFTLFNLQGTGFAVLLRVSFCILSHSISFVKSFFQVFSNFFKVFHASLRSPSNSVILAHRFPFVKKFFQILSNFFSICIFLLPSRTALIYYHAHPILSSTFFDFFQVFYLWFFRSSGRSILSLSRSFLSLLRRIPRPPGYGVR